MTSGKLETVHVINEIRDLHHELQRWIRGDIDRDYSIISHRQAPDLTVVSPRGSMKTMNQFNAQYKERYGQFTDAKFRIEIVRTKRITRTYILVVYQLKIELGELEQTRLTSAIFCYDETLRNKARWVHVHTTSVREE